jgi:hypothetical protein
MPHLLVSRTVRSWSPAALLLLAGCADRGVISGPQPPNTTFTTCVVAVAVSGVVAVLAALVLHPTRPRRAARLPAVLLALQAGGVVVVTAVLAGVAVRQGQLLHRPADAEQAASLVRIGGLDGRDAGFFHLMLGTTVIVGGLLAVVLALAARFAADEDPVERGIATAVLAAEGAGGLVGLGYVVWGGTWWPLLPALLALPVLGLAIRSSWPRRAAT